MDGWRELIVLFWKAEDAASLSLWPWNVCFVLDCYWLWQTDHHIRSHLLLTCITLILRLPAQIALFEHGPLDVAVPAENEASKFPNTVSTNRKNAPKLHKASSCHHWLPAYEFYGLFVVFFFFFFYYFLLPLSSFYRYLAYVFKPAGLSFVVCWLQKQPKS